MRYLSGFLLFTVFISSLTPARSQQKTEREQLEQFQKKLKDAAETAIPSIACIVVSRSEHYPKIANPGNIPGKLGEFDLKDFLKNNNSTEKIKLALSLDLADQLRIPDHGYVNGVVIDKSGLVLTPYHAIEGATKLYVFLPRKEGKPVGCYADIHAADARSDLAVLKLINPPNELKAITMADVRTSIKGKQQPTMYQGKLFGLIASSYKAGFILDRPSIEFGSITNIRFRKESEPKALIMDSYYKYGFLLEHDVKLNARVTGGVLINLDGEMLGMTTSTAVVFNQELGPGYAIPTDESVRRVIDVLRKGEEVEYGFLGIEPEQTANGVMIRKVQQNSSAFIAGLKENSFITHINEFPTNTYQDLLLHAGNALAGASVSLTVKPSVWDRQQKVVTLTLGKFKLDQPFIASVRPEPVFGIKVDYLNMAPKATLPAQMIYAGENAVPGVWIREITQNSPAANVFKTLGEDTGSWVITHVNGTPIFTPADFYKAAKGQASVKLSLWDWNETQRRELTLP
jgi:serine protease Do